MKRDSKTTASIKAVSLVWAGLVFGVLLGGYLLTLWRLDAESIWHDEGWSIRALRGPFTTPDDNTPYLYYTYMHLLWRLGIGETPFALRYGSVLLGLLTVAFAIRVAGQWFGRPAGVIAGILVAASPLLWEYAQEVRAYVAVPLIALALLWTADRVLTYLPNQVVPRSIWVTLWLIEVAGLYTHNLVVPLVIWLNIAVGIIWLWRRDWQHMVTWAGLQLLMILAYTAWLLTQSPSGTPLNTPPEIGFSLVRDIWRSYFLPSLPQLRTTENYFWVDLAGILAIFLGTALAILERSRRAWLLISQTTLVPIFSTALILQAHIDFHPRYYIAAVPAALLIIVAGIRALTKFEPMLISGGYAVLAIGAGSIAAFSLGDIADTRTFQHDDFEGLARYYATLPEDAVILIPYEREPALQDYYAEKFDIQARFVNIPLHSDADTAISQLNQVAGSRQPIEFLTWFQLPADVRGMYSCMLAASSSHVGQPHTLFGVETTHYLLNGPLEFQPLAATPRYREIELENARWMTSSGGSTCIETQWQLAEPTNDDWKSAASILNPLGGTIAQDDATIARRDQTPTGEWNISDGGVAYNLLQLPVGAPPTEYSLDLTVYSDHLPSGIDLLSGEGAPIGKVYNFAESLPLQGVPFNDEATPALLATNITGWTIDASQPLEVTIQVAGQAITPDAAGIVNIYLRGQGLELQTTAPYGYLFWHRFELPPDTPEGEITLSIETTEVGTFTVKNIEHTFEPPDFSTAVDVVVPNVAALAGVTVPNSEISVDEALPITLVWRAESPTEIPLTVFVQLLDAGGRLLAQSDSVPASDTRPTMGWVAGEYIQDNHRLTFRVEEYVQNYAGPAYFIVGFYDPTTFERIIVENGQDHIRLPVEITIKN